MPQLKKITMINERFKLGNIDVGGSITVKSVFINILEGLSDDIRFYEVNLILDIKMLLNENIEVNHESRLRWHLKEHEVKELRKNGLIRKKL